jgi:hypothetical protein
MAPRTPDQGNDHPVWSVRGDRTGFDCRAHQRRISSGQGQGTAIGAAQRGPRDVKAHGPGSRHSNPLGQNGLESVYRENYGCLSVHAPPFHPFQTLDLSAQGHGAVATSNPQPVHAWSVAHDGGSGPSHCDAATARDVEGLKYVNQRVTTQPLCP